MRLHVLPVISLEAKLFVANVTAKQILPLGMFLFHVFIKVTLFEHTAGHKCYNQTFSEKPRALTVGVFLDYSWMKNCPQMSHTSIFFLQPLNQHNPFYAKEKNRNFMPALWVIHNTFLSGPGFFQHYIPLCARDFSEV